MAPAVTAPWRIRWLPLCKAKKIQQCELAIEQLKRTVHVPNTNWSFIHSAKLYYMCHGARVDRNNTCFWQSLPGRRIILNGKKREKPVEIYIYLYLYTYIFITWGTLWILENKNITKDLAITFPSQSLGCSRCARARRLNPVPKRQVSWPMGL